MDIDNGAFCRKEAKNRFEALGSIVNVINSTLDFERILEVIMDNAMELMQAERGFIMILSPCSNQLEFRIARNLDKKRLESDELEISRTIVKEVFKTKKAILTHNASQDPRYKDNPSVKVFGLRSVIAVPLIVKGESIGVIYLDNRLKNGVFTEFDLDFMKIFADEIAIAMENARLEQEKELIRELFRHYVSPEVAEEIISRGKEFDLKGEKREVTIFFVDIRGFSGLSERIPPQDLVAQLNEYFQEIVHIIFEYRGTLLKFLGDGLMVAFGAPLAEKDDAIRAVCAGYEILRRVDLLNENWQKNGKPIFRVGIGMYTGEAIVGTIGCYERREYSVIGDVPNTAFRLEKLNKDYGCSFIIGDTTWIKVKDHFRTESLGMAMLQGKSEPVGIYKIV